MALVGALPAAVVEGRLLSVRRNGASDEAVTRLPPGYSLESGGPGRPVLRRADGSAVAAVAFSAFGPTPEMIHEAAEEGRLRRRSPMGGNGEEGSGG